MRWPRMHMSLSDDRKQSDGLDENGQARGSLWTSSLCAWKLSVHPRSSHAHRQGILSIRVSRNCSPRFNTVYLAPARRKVQVKPRRFVLESAQIVEEVNSALCHGAEILYKPIRQRPVKWDHFSQGSTDSQFLGKPITLRSSGVPPPSTSPEGKLRIWARKV